MTTKTTIDDMEIYGYTPTKNSMGVMWRQIRTLIQALILTQIALVTLHMPILAIVIAVIVLWFAYQINKI